MEGSGQDQDMEEAGGEDTGTVLLATHDHSSMFMEDPEMDFWNNRQYDESVSVQSKSETCSVVESSPATKQPHGMSDVI